MPELSRILNMLERDGALELDYPTDPIPPQPQPTEVYEVDYQRLFPRRVPGRDGDADYELYGDDWGIDGGLAEDLAGRAGRGYRSNEPPEWDIWAWYQQIHFFGPDWGIFVTQHGLIECARRIAGAASPVHPRQSQSFAKATIRAAFAVLFLHEQYHHKTESAAIRMHVVERRGVYPPYHHSVYRPAKGTSDLIEEGLASADSWKRILESAHKKWIGDLISSAARDYLELSFPMAPPGYSNAQHLCKPGPFKDTENTLLAALQEAQFPPKRLDCAEFSVATNLNKSMFTLAQRIWTLVPSGAQSILPTHPAITPLQTKKLERVIQKQGFTPVKGGGKGSHQKYRNANGQMVILPHRKEASLGVLRSTAAALRLNVAQLEELARQT